MFGRKRDIPPYEIMRPGGREARQKPASVWRSPQGASPEATGGGGISDWLTGGEPVVLRLPKGMAVLVAAGVLLLIVAGYWVGHARGRAAADARHRGAMESMERVRQAPPVPVFVDPGRSDSPQDAQPAGSPADPREPGLNYLIIARYPEAEARRLASFLSGHGVETLITNSDNPRFYLVVGAEGFDGPTSGAAYKRQLMRLGRQWKAHNGNRGSDLSDMWWKKFE